MLNLVSKVFQNRFARLASEGRPTAGDFLRISGCRTGKGKAGVYGRRFLENLRP